MEFILTRDSFQFMGRSEELAVWQEDKYRAWYEMPWTMPGARDAKESSERLFARLACFFHKTMSSQRDISLVREEASFSWDPRDLMDDVLTGDLLIYREQLDPAWLDAQFNQLLGHFQRDLRSYPGSVTEYYNDRGLSFPIPDRIFFHLVENKTMPEQGPFAFMASYSEEEEGRVQHHPLSYALQKYSHDQEKILRIMRSIAILEKESTLIKGLLESGELFHPIYFTRDEAWQFLRELELYEEAGVKCRIPNWWTRKNRRASMSLKVSEGGHFSKDKLLSFVPEFSIGDTTLSYEELREFLRQSEGLRLFKGQWIEVDHKKILSLLARYDELSEKIWEGLTFQETLRLSVDEDEGLDIDEVLAYFQERVRAYEADLSPHPPASLRATLRPYQEEGRRWLVAMDAVGLGVILADDMGLGKTVQIIAYLDSLRERLLAGQAAEQTGDSSPDESPAAEAEAESTAAESGRELKALIVVPTSLLANWEKEIQKFAPHIPYRICHGPARELGDSITLTTYGIVRNEAALAEQNWDVIILDEAQTIKNPSTLQTKAVKHLRGRMKIALTGTPIENDLMDLFSIFDFTQPGYLGTAREFKTYSDALGKQPGGYARLRQSVSPFILRRLKTDRAIIRDLPEKLEVKEYIDLTPKQAALYRKVLRNFEAALTDATGMGRRGLILNTLQSLKQVTNHPDQYSGLPNYKGTESGKFLRLAELVKQIYEARERVLIFTQYREIIPHLERFLCATLGNEVEPLSISGQTPVKKRQEIVDRFNGDIYHPFMVLSLKAGGVGLNLTGANHVIHFDRWWNPQVEQQATDRAYRIGQEKNVMVHYFICRDTLDEAIDEMLEKKKALADEVIAENKAPTLTEMDDDALRAFFALRKED